MGKKYMDKAVQRKHCDVMLEADYYVQNPTHTPKNFWHRFRMNNELFTKIVYGVKEYDDYFMWKKNHRIAWFHLNARFP
jgi:hypothetical protein